MGGQQQHSIQGLGSSESCQHQAVLRQSPVCKAKVKCKCGYLHARFNAKHAEPLKEGRKRYRRGLPASAHAATAPSFAGFVALESLRIASVVLGVRLSQTLDNLDTKRSLLRDFVVPALWLWKVRSEGEGPGC